MAGERTGRCQCGAVHYTLRGEPVFTYACHCGSCQKRTGSAFSLGQVVVLNDLAVEGEISTWSRTSDDGNTNTRHSCAACGNIIYGTDDTNAGFAKLQPGTLDDTREVMPEVHMWTQAKQGWVVIPEGVPRYETQPDSPLQLLEDALAWRAGR